MNFLSFLQGHSARIIGLFLACILFTSVLAGCGQQTDSPDSLVGHWETSNICHVNSQSSSSTLIIGSDIWFFENGHYILPDSPLDTGGEYFTMGHTADEFVEIDTKQANYTFEYLILNGSSTSTGTTLTLTDVHGGATFCTLQKAS